MTTTNNDGANLRSSRPSLRSSRFRHSPKQDPSRPRKRLLGELQQVELMQTVLVWLR